MICLIGDASTTDWNGVFQTLGTWAGALILLWYTYETFRLRKNSTDQLDLMRDQSQITADQLQLAQQQLQIAHDQMLLMRVNLDRDIQEQLRENEPQLRFVYASHNGQSEWTWRVTNHGAAITRLSITGGASYRPQIAPQDLFGHEQTGRFTLQSGSNTQTAPFSFAFSITYRTGLNQLGTKNYVVEGTTITESLTFRA